MPKVTSATARRRRHKRVLQMTKGHRGVRHLRYKQAKESMLHALMYAYAHRREHKGDFRRLWIARINAATRQEGMSYSQFMHGLRKVGVEVNRKMLADLAVRNSQEFTRMVSLARESL